MAVAKARVAVGEALDSGDPGEPNAGKVVLFDFPDDFSLGIDLQDTVSVSSSNEGVALGIRTTLKRWFPNASGP